MPRTRSAKKEALELIEKLPKTDLHVHLDGSLRLSTILELAEKQKVKLPAYDEPGLREAMHLGENCGSLVEDLKAFDGTLRVMQTADSLARAAYEGFFDEGRAIGVGVSLRIDAGRLRVRIVQPDSPAGRAGVRRGDRIVSVDGVGADALIAAGTVAAAFGPAEVGVVLRLGLERDGTPFELSLAKADYAVAPVLATRVIERPGGRVGYVALHTFTEPARQAWADAIATVRAAGARRLVVDLRDNGGGRLYVAAEVAGALAPAGATGQPFTVLVHNARRAADDLTIPLPAHAATGAFDRVAWLVSDASCSASESLMLAKIEKVFERRG